MGIYEELGVRPLINARCILGRYGDSLTEPAVLDAMVEAAQSHVSMVELNEAVSQKLADMTGNEAAMVCAGAAHGGQIAIAGCMTGLDEGKRAQLPDTTGMCNEVVMKQFWSEAVVIHPTGCKVVRIEGEDDREIEESLSRAITDQTAAIFTAASHRQSSLSLPIAVEVGKARGVPVIVDAAYDLPPKENLWYYTKELGVDAVIFSGGKALRGPSSTGLIVGRKEIVDSCRSHARPNGGVGFASKVGKEEVVGLYVAVKRLLEEGEEDRYQRYRRQMDYIEAELGNIPFLGLSRHEHGSWGDEFGVALHFEEGAPFTGVRSYLAEGTPYIELSSQFADLFVCVSTLKDGDEVPVVEELKKALAVRA